MSCFDKLTWDYIKWVSKLCDPLYVVLFGSSAEGCIKSDMDIFTIVKKTNKELINSVSDFTVKFHQDYSLEKDYDIPYEKKTIYSEEDIKNVLSANGFIYKYDKFLIPTIRMSPDFLWSDNMKYRLFLNALTTKNRLLFWNKNEFKKLENKCWEVIIRIIFSQRKDKYFSIREVYELMIKSDFDLSTWIHYLGYKQKNEKYILNKLDDLFSIFINEWKLFEDKGKYTINSIRMNDLIKKHTNFEKISKSPEISNVLDKNIDFITNKNPETPLVLKQDYDISIKEITEYPDYTNKDVNEKISNFLWLDENEVSICQWSLDAIYNIPKCISFDEWVIIEPTYRWYEEWLKNKWSSYAKFYLNEDFSLDINQLNEAIKQKSLVFICNPNNPTGTYINNEDVLKLVKNNKNSHFILDETYLLFDQNFNDISFKKCLSQVENVSIVFSLSKFFNIPWIRVWAFASNPLIVNKFKTINTPYYIDAVSKWILKKCLEDKYFIDRSRISLSKNKELLFEKLKLIDYFDVKYIEYGNFFMVKILDENISSKKIERFLKDNWINIKSCEWLYQWLEWDRLRISVNNEENNNILIDILNNKKNIYQNCVYNESFI